MNTRVRATWGRRTAAEYRSAAVASEMLHWSLVLGLEPGIVDRLHALVAEERDHADLSRAVHAAAGGAPEEAGITREALCLGMAVGEALERRAVLAAFQEFVVHETVALALFREMQRRPMVPVVQDAIVRIVRDEARHRRLGWLLVDALLARTGEGPWLAQRVRPAIDGVLHGYRGAAEAPSVEEAAWGILDPRVASAAIRRAVEGNLATNLSRRGLA
jgi:hypothetical protein